MRQSERTTERSVDPRFFGAFTDLAAALAATPAPGADRWLQRSRHRARVAGCRHKDFDQAARLARS